VRRWGGMIGDVADGKGTLVRDEGGQISFYLPKQNKHRRKERYAKSSLPFLTSSEELCEVSYIFLEIV
jgi:hypothetical protein